MRVRINKTKVIEITKFDVVYGEIRISGIDFCYTSTNPELLESYDALCSNLLRNGYLDLSEYHFGSNIGNYTNSDFTP